MTKKIGLFICFFLLLIKILPAQQIDPLKASGTIAGDHYFRLDYDNDYFTKMDHYYTQGIHLEYVAPQLRKFPLMKLLVRSSGSMYKYGLAIDHAGYTPTSINADYILQGDRPYAATLTLNTFVIGNDTLRNRRISAALTLGVIGPAAFGNQMQTGIHEWLNNPLPMGWQFQIANDIIIDYRINYEKRIANAGNFLQLSVGGDLRVGTVNQKLRIGPTILTGAFNDPYRYYTTRRSGKHLQYYFFGHPFVQLVGYDATLQGGIFNRKSPYTIAGANINRLVYGADAGITFSTHGFYFSYVQSIITKEFKTGKYHRWGGVRMAVSF